jgi:ATPase family AAA domain-containing protein 2
LEGDINAPPVEPVPVPQIETITHTQIVEIQSGPNGVADTANEQQTETLRIEELCVVNQSQPETQEVVPPIAPPSVAPQPRPHIYEMDLERVHVELYKSKYLTPADFLNDIRKIAHNAGVYADKDPDRLFKAQALLTAAEVSILDFDQQFRLECERMAIRERKRREERRKAKSLDKANQENEGSDSANVYAPGTRRSARHNGQQPEITITDPLQLERRLKRQRSTDGGTDRRSASEEVGEGRTPKRSRVNSDAEDVDPLNIGTPSFAPPKANTVRFVDDQQPSDLNLSNDSMSNDTNHMPSRKAGGFDPALLNPLPAQPSLPVDWKPSLLDGSVSSPTISPTPNMPIPRRPHSPNPFLPHSMSAPLAVNEVPSTQLQEQGPAAEPSVSLSQIAEKPDEGFLELPEHMEIERTPTPLPDFRVDEAQLSYLKEALCSQTQSLTIEELEQLRATCLGVVWQHRTEWDRGELMKQLVKIVQEFVEEVSLDDMSLSP